jgi:dTDP-4-dehydrorhamnose reductase
MRAYVTGGGGFVGSNVTRVFAAHGATVLAPAHGDVDVTDATSVAASIGAFGPDVVIHCAILNDPERMHDDHTAAWNAYVGATRHVVDAANAAAAKVVLVSTDWVFDGRHPGAGERTPPNPVNLYGVLKMASELVVAERARDGAVARIAGVNGVHWARPATPRAQDLGFGYLVASIVDALSAGEPFTVWESADINMVATPSLASECAEMMWRIAESGARGVFHCCGGEAVTRRRLAELTATVFDLDPSLLRWGPPPAVATGLDRIPYDTSLDATATASALGLDLISATDVLRRFRHERETRAFDA